MSYFQNVLDAFSNSLPSLKSRKANFSESPEKVKYKKIGNYVLLTTIGSGTFSKVKLGIHLPTQQKVAIKILDKSLIKDESDIKRITREVHILTILRHPNIVQLFETIPSERHIYIIMEYVEGKDLFKYINSKNRLDEIKASLLFRQLISCIEYIHTLGIVHRDIKPENILLNLNHNNIKLVDFGLSNSYKHGSLLKTACGSPCYAAPEMISGKEYDGLYSDLWSCGVVLYCMLVGKLPFDDENLKVLYHNIKTGNYIIPNFLSNISKDIIKKILTTDPQQRITLNQIKQHPFFLLAENFGKLNKGLIIGIQDIPIDNDIVKYMKNKYYKDNIDITETFIKNAITQNEHNDITAIYYLTLKNKDVILKENSIKENNEENNNENNIINKENNIIKKENNLVNNEIDKNIKKSKENDKVFNKTTNMSNFKKIFNNIKKINFDEKSIKRKQFLLKNKDKMPINNDKIINTNINANNTNNNRFNVVVINNILPDNRSFNNKVNHLNEEGYLNTMNENYSNLKNDRYNLHMNLNKIMNKKILPKTKTNSRNRFIKNANLYLNKKITKEANKLNKSNKTENPFISNNTNHSINTKNNNSKVKSNIINNLEYSLNKIKKINYRNINLNQIELNSPFNNIKKNTALTTKTDFYKNEKKYKNKEDCFDSGLKNINMKKIFFETKNERNKNETNEGLNKTDIISIHIKNKSTTNPGRNKIKVATNKKQNNYSLSLNNNTPINLYYNNEKKVYNNNVLENTLSKLFKNRFNISLKKKTEFTINNPMNIVKQLSIQSNEKNSRNNKKLDFRKASNFSKIIKKSLSRKNKKSFYISNSTNSKDKSPNNIKKIEIYQGNVPKTNNDNICTSPSTNICKIISKKQINDKNNISINSMNSSSLYANTNPNININNNQKTFLSEIDALNPIKKIIYKKNKKKTLSFSININK